VAGNSMLCGSWIPPAAMGTLQAGQVLDSDPFTKVTVQVGSADAQHVTLVHNSPRQQIQYTYRRQDGLLVRTLFNDRFNQLNMSNQIELSLVSTE
jgi:transposase